MYLLFVFFIADLGWGDDGFGHSLKELNNWSTTSSHGRCLKSHWPSKDHLVVNGNSNGSKYIYIMRNPIDQIISHWNQVYGMGFHYGTTHIKSIDDKDAFNTFFNNWINGNVENGSWFHHVSSWYKRYIDNQGNDSDNISNNVLFIRYEELKLNPNEGIRKIAKFVNVDLTDDRLEKVLELTSFEQMKLADQNDVGLQFMRYLGVLRTSHIRQGGKSTDGNRDGSGNHMKFFSKSQIEQLEKEYEEKLKPLGMPREWVFIDKYF